MNAGRARGGGLASHLKRSHALLLAGGVAVFASALGGWAAAGRPSVAKGPPARLAKVVHAEGNTGGVTATGRDGRALQVLEGAAVPCGTTLTTDGRTRVRLELEGGTVVALDRASRLVYRAAADVSLESGALVADLGPGRSLVAASAIAAVRSLEGRYALTVDERRMSVGVARGDVVLRALRSPGADDVSIHPGEEADLAAGAARPGITATGDLGQRIAFGEGFETQRDDDGPPSGVGELRARRPGSKDELDGAVRLARHDVKARVAGAMARTEVDETFVNTTDRELEGVWRFPLPPDARLERLALEVDGQLVEGEFVDAQRAAGIWRGVIQHAAPSAPKPVDAIVWVPGPWRDPALLDWQRGGRAELKIFPIPRKGTRRIVLAYTQHVEPAGGVRRYVYPLASRVGAAPIDEASFDVRVVGSDPDVGLRARGYELTPEPRVGSGPASLSMSRTAFLPTGDLVVEYATADRTAEASTVAFAPSASHDDPFVAVALRPRLPSRIAERGRDQVILVDSGRAMFGERLRRAIRMAVELVQQMDRRDRVAVLACDLECRPMPGGWHAPGAAAAHDVDAFLAGLTADGASDLVGAVRAAAAVSDRRAEHDLRVVLLSDGIATAGVRGRARLAPEVAEALSDARSELVAVPLGSDADVETLSEMAQGGGGAVVPYGAGLSLEAAALDVLSATYGATLRDVQLTLPEGLHELSPKNLAPLRAGAETLVAARMTGDHVTGDLVLRGKLAGEPFEARWPVDVRATSDEGNAWAARVWAASRVADDERDGDEAARVEAVALSHRFRVPSRFTSLLVLESEAMFHAFGVARSEPTFAWTGETEGQANDVSATSEEPAGDELAPKPGEISGGGSLADLGRQAYASRAAPEKKADDDVAPRPPPAPTAAASPTAGAPADRGGGSGFATKAPPAASWAPAPPVVVARPAPRVPARGRWMRRIWFRTAAIAADERSPVDAARLEAARAALVAAPDLRQRHADLAKLLIRSGKASELEALVADWSSRDPLDPDLLTARATAQAWRGDRDAALRVLSGALAAPALSVAGQFDMASALARAMERANRPGPACAMRVAAAETKPDDAPAVAAAVACERRRGNEASAARWLANAKDDPTRTRLAAAVAKALAASAQPEALVGDVVVDATWDDGSGADLDVGIIDPAGRRLSWASAAARVRARDCTSRSHEALAISSGAAGAFVIDVARADGREAAGVPVRGKLRITSLGQTQVVPFVLAGGRAPVARVDVRFDSRLEPITPAFSWRPDAAPL